MFGHMNATVLVRLDAGQDLEVAVAQLLATTEYPQIARWIQFPTVVALFLLVPKDPGRIRLRPPRWGLVLGGFRGPKVWRLQPYRPRRAA